MTVSGKVTNTDANLAITTHNQVTVNPINETTYIQGIARIAILSNTLTVNSGGSLDVASKDYSFVMVPCACSQLPSHNGASATNVCPNAIPYGSNIRPITLGSGSGQLPGGGAIYLDVNNFINNGILDVNGGYVGGYYDGAAGSIWIKGCNINGTGNYYAYGVSKGPGGRVTIYYCPSSANWYNAYSASKIAVGTGTLFGYNLAFIVESISPSRGSLQGGTTLSITGKGFSAGTSSVLIDNNPYLSITAVSDTSITCITPPGNSLGSKNIKVTIGDYNTVFESFTYSPLAKANSSNTALVEAGNVEIVDAEDNNMVYNNPNPNTLNRFVKVKVSNVKNIQVYQPTCQPLQQ